MSSPPSISSTSTPLTSRTRLRRGLSLLAVLPIVILPTRVQEQLPQSVERVPSRTATKFISSTVEELPHDFETMDIDHQLRLLAMKEMELVELKDRRRDLDQLISTNEAQLHRLRVVIQRSLYSQMSTPTQAPQSTPTPSRNGSLKRTSRRSPPASTNRPRTNSNPRDEAIMATRRRLGGVDERWSLFFDDPLRHRPEELVAQVSSSLWSFVSDMKQGMLSRLDEETTVVNNSDDDDDENSEEGDIQVDLSMYQAIRRKQESDHHPYVAY